MFTRLGANLSKSLALATSRVCSPKMPRIASVMDIDGSDSLPPSSSNPLQSASATRSRTGTKSTRTRTANPMALGDEDGTDAMEEDGVAGRGRPEAEEDGAGPQNRRRRPKGQMNMDVPPVRDATGEKVMESFELFLKSYAVICVTSRPIN